LKFSNQTNSVLMPKASGTSSDCHSACAAGQMKNTMVTASWGATSA
jgi:hypothetical protein